MMQQSGAQDARAKTAPAYVIAEIEVKDPATYQSYLDHNSATIAAYGGRFLARGGKTAAFAGEPPHRIAIYVFDSMEKAQAFRDSEAYKATIADRDRSSNFRAYIVEGLQP
jgi:uncharacterized protein (DUF1330 family)